MWVYDYRTKKEYLASTPRSKFYCYRSLEIEPIPGQPCTILVRKGMEEGRKPEGKYEQLVLSTKPLVPSLPQKD